MTVLYYHLFTNSQVLQCTAHNFSFQEACKKPFPIQYNISKNMVSFAFSEISYRLFFDQDELSFPSCKVILYSVNQTISFQTSFKHLHAVLQKFCCSPTARFPLYKITPSSAVQHRLRKVYCNEQSKIAMFY